MSTTVDQRVVEMRFDNQRFEQNVATSMSTLAKLKQSLNLSGASKGLESINAAAKNNNISALGTAAETVGVKFSAMQVMATTALANITNQAVNTAKRMVSALTIDPIKTGLSEYETQINAVQTILANTSSKGSTIEDVNKALDELNAYADKTIYNFTEMTRNIGTFTAAGVDLETSVSAIQGIANLAAVSGSTSQQASTAMYQLSQALASGTVKLMDWNSVVNAGMGGEVFQNALKETAKIHGVAIDQMIEEEGSFRETLQNGWLTSEILTETLNNFTLAAKEGSDQWNEYKKSLMDKGYSEAQAVEILKMANTATDAATKVKTFTQLWDVMKESAQSGWSQTWEIIIGDFEQAKALLSPLADVATGIINKMSDARNAVLKIAMASPFAKIAEKVEAVSKSTEKVVDTTKKYADVVEKVMGGEYGNGEDRWRKLCDEGYNWAKVQNMINKELGSSVRHNEELWAVQEDLNTTRATTVEQLAEMSEGQLRSYGFTTEEIQSLKDLKTAAEAAGYSVSEVLANPDLLSGRTLLIDGFKNLGEAVLNVFTIAKKTWDSIFPPKSVEERAESIYNLIAAFRKFTSGLVLLDENGEYVNENGKKIERTFKGLFAAIDIVSTLVAGPLKLAFKAITAILGYFDLNILDVTANIGDAIVKFRDMVDVDKLFTKGLNVIIPLISKAAEGIRDWVDSLKGASPEEVAKAIVSGLKNAVKFAKEAFGEIKKLFTGHFSKLSSGGLSGFIDDLTEKLKFAGEVIVEFVKMAYNKFGEVTGIKLPSWDIVSGFINGIWDGIKRTGNAIYEFAKSIITKFCDVLGIESPSKVFIALGGFVVAGLLLGLTKMFPEAWNTIKELGSGLIETISKIDFGAIFAAVLTGGLTIALVKFADGFQKFGKMFKGLGEMFEEFGGAAKRMSKGVKKLLGGLGSMFSGIGFEHIGKGILNMAIAIGVLAASVYVLAQLDSAKLWEAMAAIALLSGVIVALALVVDKMNDAEGLKDAAKDSLGVTSLLAIAGSLVLVAIALEKMGNIDEGKIAQAIGCFVVAVAGIATIMGVIGKTVKGKSAQNIDKVGKMLLKLSLTLLLMVGVLKVASMLSPEEAKRGGIIVGGLAAGILLFVAGLAAIEKFIGGTNTNKLGSGLLKISATMLIMVGIMKFAAGLSRDEIVKGGSVLAGLALGIVALIAGLALIYDRIGPTDTTKIGSTLLGISVAMAVMVGVMKLIARMEWSELGKGALGLAALGLFITGLIMATNFVTTKDLKGVGTTLLLTSAAIGILALTVALLGFLDIGHLAKGILAVGLLSTFMAGLMIASGKAKDCKGNLIVMTIAIVAMAGAIAALSFVDGTKLAGATVALGVLMGMFALMIKMAGSVNKGLGVLIVLTVAIGAMTGALYLLSKLETQASLQNALALSVLMVAVSAVMLIISKMNISMAGALKGVLSLTAMAVPMLAFVGVLALASGIENARANAVMLTLLMGAMTLLLIPLTLIGSFIAPALLGVLSLTAMAVPMLAFVGVLALMEGIKNAQANADLLTDLMTRLTAMLVVVGVVGPLALVGITAMAALEALIVATIALAIGIGALFEYFPKLEEFLNTGLPILEKVAYSIGNFAGQLIAGFAEGVMSSLPTIGTYLADFMNNAQPFFDGISALDAGATIAGAGAIAGAILAITAADLISNVTSWLSGGSSFADLGSDLSAFWAEAKGFFTDLGSVDTAVIDAAKNIAGVILALTAADLLSQLTSWFTGEASLTSFGDELKPFGESMVAFSEAVSGNIDEGAVTAAANAAKVMVELTKSLPATDGVLQWIMGEQNLATFGTQLISFGTAIVGFSKTVSEDGAINTEAIQAAATAGDIMVALTKSLPKTDGLLQWIMGEQNLSTFGTQLTSFGKAICGFSSTVSAEGAINAEAITAAANAGSIMAALATELPSTGGLLQWIMGEKNLESFGAQLKGFGEGIAAFSTAIAGKINSTDITAAVDAAKALAAMNTEVGDGWDGLGESNMVDLAQAAQKFGKEIAKYASSIAGTDFSASSTAISTATSLAELCKSTAELDSSGVKTLKTAINTLSDAKVSDFITTFTSENLGSALTKVTSIKGKIVSLAGMDTSGVSTFTTAIDNLADANVEGIVDAFEVSIPDIKATAAKLGQALVDGLESKKSALTKLAGEMVKAAKDKLDDYDSKFKSAGKELFEKFIDGIEDKKSAVKTACGDAAKAGKTKIRDYYDDFKSAGKYLVEGFVAGIDANTYKAKATSKAMAEAAYEAAKEALKINSPSKTFYELGSGTIEGFVNAVLDGNRLVRNTSADMADSAHDGLSSAIGKVISVLDADMDLQPTIRPVLDLSSVQAGVGAIDGMFNNTHTVGTMANIRAISSMMGQNGQNGNDDVISAINKLGKQLGNVGSTSYNINGVSYADGTDVTEAIKTIVRAATMERRR